MRTAEREMVRHALKMEKEARENAFQQLVQAGHVTVMLDDQPDVIRVRIDGEFFLDTRSTFPSTVLMAKLQLAIAAGQSDRNCPLGTGHAMDGFRYAAMDMGRRMHAHYDAVWRDEIHDFKTGADYLLVVKPRIRKGLRP